MGLAPQILPVVSVHTALFVVILAPWTPNSFEVKHVEIRIFRLDVVKEVNRDLVLRVGKGAHLSIFAVVHFVWICLTKLTLVLFRMIKLFNSVVSFQAFFSVAQALEIVLLAGDLWAHLTGVCSKLSPFVFLKIVVVEAPLWIVLVLVAIVRQDGWARLGLKLCQIEEY
jgi:hypothetical protein